MPPGPPTVLQTAGSPHFVFWLNDIHRRYLYRLPLATGGRSVCSCVTGTRGCMVLLRALRWSLGGGGKAGRLRAAPSLGAQIAAGRDKAVPEYQASELGVRASLLWAGTPAQCRGRSGSRSRASASPPHALPHPRLQMALDFLL